MKLQPPHLPSSSYRFTVEMQLPGMQQLPRDVFLDSYPGAGPHEFGLSIVHAATRETILCTI